MKKKLAAILAAGATLALSAVLLAGCSSGGNEAQSETTDESAASEEPYTLIVGFDQSYPPYGFVGSDGEFTGFDLDLAAEVAERNGWNVEYSAIDWDAKDPLLNSGSITCIWNGFTYEGREDDYTWSEPYMLNEQVIVVRADSGIEDESGLAGKIVMTQVESAALGVLENTEEGGKADLAATFAELQTIGDYNNAFMQLESGMVDAVACDLSIADYQMAANPDAYKIITTLSSEHYAVGFAIGDEETANTVTETLRAMYEDGTVEELCEKYAEYGLSYDNWILK